MRRGMRVWGVRIRGVQIRGVRIRGVLPEPGAERVLAVTTLVQTTGRGIWLTAGALFLTQSVGLPVGQVAAGMAIAAALSFVSATPLGYLADRLGPRGFQSLGIAIGGLSLAGLVLVHSFPAYLLCASLGALADSAVRGARGAWMGRAVAPEKRVRTRAYLRAVTNLGISIGGVLGGLGLAVGTRSAYVWLILGDAVAYLLAALVVLRLPWLAPVARPAGGPRLVALRDRPFLSFVALDGVLAMQYELLNLILPLWIIQYTDAPVWTVAVLMVVNTTMIVLLQVRLSRGADTLAGAARAGRRAGILLAVSCLVFASSAWGSAPVAVGLLVVGAVVHGFGELSQAAAGWGISFGLAPADAHGQYQGAYSMGMQGGRVVAPPVLTGLILGLGAPGWAVVAVIFVAAGLALPAIVAWARRNRPTGVTREDELATSGSV